MIDAEGLPETAQSIAGGTCSEKDPLRNTAGALLVRAVHLGKASGRYHVHRRNDLRDMWSDESPSPQTQHYDGNLAFFEDSAHSQARASVTICRSIGKRFRPNFSRVKPGE